MKISAPNYTVTDDDVAHFLSVAHRHKVTRGLPKGVTHEDLRLAMQYVINRINQRSVDTKPC